MKRQQPDLAELTEWAVEARYPGDWPDPTVQDAQRAAKQARAVYDCVAADLERHNVQIDETGGH